MKLTRDELDSKVKEFVVSNKDYLRDNMNNMMELPEVTELFSTTGWTLGEYQELCKDEAFDLEKEIESFVTQMELLGVPKDEIEAILLEVYKERDEHFFGIE